MKHIYAFEQVEDYRKFRPVIERFQSKLKAYQMVLEEDYQLNDLPKGIVWTTKELATETFSQIEIPAYTNRNNVFFSPDLDGWKELFLQQVEGCPDPLLGDFYQNLSESYIVTILGHELTHHLDLFLDDWDDEREDSIWFEEGMCEYLPRRNMLTDAEFGEIVKVETRLVERFADSYGHQTLDEFGTKTYEGSLSSILFQYWRSFLTVKYLVEEKADGNVQEVFREYHRWDQEGRKVPLSEFFNVGRLTFESK
ncbi:hypothetical protein [Alkalihalobacillus pseudalcaliphilus]|uniref:hypothetical protein n=1 Tax=Alkalihalobacillus pseudalcaliphilus TaxID=79884 RepID=UPI00069ECD9E|nr:hypothetical protein [Alkalihalobacillus pseudalcaliphilus]